MSENITKTRNWLFLVYPDSAPENWIQQIDALQVPWCHSPLHDPDISSETPDEERRKKHWHCLISFDGPKSYNCVKFIQDITNGTKLMPCNSVKGSVRYFVHLDHPHRQQFSGGLSEIHTYNGLCIQDMIVPSSSEKQRYVDEMCSWIKKTGCIEFSDLCDEARSFHYDTWWYCLNNTSTSIMKSYCTSVREKKYDEDKAKAKEDMERKQAAAKHLSDVAKAQALNEEETLSSWYDHELGFSDSI